MPRLGSKDLRDALAQASVQSIQVAAAWLAKALRQLVAVQTGPFRRTGFGQSTIGMERTATGASVGVGPMSVPPGRLGLKANGEYKKMPDMSKIMFGNYMAAMDYYGSHPWLWAGFKRYEKTFIAILKRQLKIRMAGMLGTGGHFPAVVR